MTLQVSKPAPTFKANAVMPDNCFNENFNLEDYKGKYVVLFFWPLDFTFVCPTEILEFNKKLEAFKKRGVEVIGVSTDSHYSHLAWKNQDVRVGGIGNVQFPIVSDFSKSISRDYGVLLEDSGVALRGSFLIDRDGILQHMVVNNLPLGRNIDEMLRMVDALQYTEKHGEVCPAGWQQGADTMKEEHGSLQSYFERHAVEYK